ncbi:hypothetical protein KZX37_02940 [Microbacterium sp. EYE_5]|uniref:DUF6049 family protein n=2 Tax=unclassified Microbacterium TaxID=2609290 RepID=UPI00200506B4|nr:MULTISPECIES: DUF6049 family protein [unclassified Microbacterium]MCK6084848.1 hypothetical protein [Microbacterium sp. EYE_384]MCK6122926.1 hypothetical protein [Microbacterium sp. EYE_80]MCK6125611.1 hypothetical protein [Microbacterium sp. EYE_79]MCK6217258.1 hypothetical protein [Microbacterium sp. EYE_5]MCK6227257.1 hypothetical protein [Microbacterium sp. EYE_77]MCK6246341.1 hypothetical protein [Microbacterium sp. EYE_78]
MDRTGTDLTMTFTPPAPGRPAAGHPDTAPPRPSSASTPRRRVRHIAPAAALAALLVALGAAPAAVAATDGDAQTQIDLALAPTADGVVGEGRSLILSVDASNPGDAPLAPGEVIVEIGERPLTTTTALDSWLDAGAANGGFDEVSRDDIAEVPADDAVSQTVSITPADTGLEDRSPGVYPIRGTYTTGDESARARSVVVIPGVTNPPAPIGVVVPVSAGPQSTGVLSADALAALTAEDGDLRELLDGVTATSAILAVDPALPASIRALGSAAPADAVEWLEDLMALPNDRFALQYGDADLASQVAADGASLLEVPSFSAYLDPANFTAPAPDDDATPAPTPTPAVPTLPTLDELTDIGAGRDSVFWPATGTAGAATVAALGALTGAEDAPVTLVPSSVVRSEAAVHARASGADLLVYDDRLSGLLEEASTTDARTNRAALLAQVTARATLGSPREPLLVTVDRATGRSSAALSETIRAATDLPGRDATGLSDLLATPADVVELDDVAPDADRVAALEAFRDAQPGLIRVSSVLDDPSVVLSSERATEMQLMGNAWLDDPEGWAEALAAQRERIATWTDGVALVLAGDITLAGSSAALVFTVRNDLPWPARVDLRAEPNDARLVITGQTPVEVGAQQTTRVEVPVTALVGSGESSVDLELRSPTGVILGDTERVAVSVRAEWESVAIVILSVLVSGLLVFGVVRTVRRRRRRLLEMVS